ncbi:MAG TPA: hypothetical protein VF164_08825 [Trueperaceae bacterium]
MPLLKPLEQRRFSEHGPVPRPLSMGSGLAVMLLCLQSGQTLVAPQGDEAETVFTVLDGDGSVREGTTTHPVRAGDVVHVMAGDDKSLVAGEGTFTVLGVRRLAERRPRGQQPAGDSG